MLAVGSGGSSLIGSWGGEGDDMGDEDGRSIMGRSSDDVDSDVEDGQWSGSIAHGEPYACA